MNGLKLSAQLNQLVSRPVLPTLCVAVSVLMVGIDFGLKFSGRISVWPTGVGCATFVLAAYLHRRFGRPNKNVAEQSQAKEGLRASSAPSATPAKSSAVESTMADAIQQQLKKCSVMVGVTIGGDSITYLMPVSTKDDWHETGATVVSVAHQLRQNGVNIAVLRPEHLRHHSPINPASARYTPMIPFFPMPKSFLSKN